MSENNETRLPNAHRGTFKVLGVRVNAVQIADVVAQIERWIEERSYGHVVATANAHVVMECRRNPQMMEAINSADLVIPDGMPIVWLGRKHGFPLMDQMLWKQHWNSRSIRVTGITSTEAPQKPWRLL